MRTSPQTPSQLPSRRSDWSSKNLAVLFLLAIFAFLIMGYHPGLEDDAFYLAAIKRNLNPALFPHDADFFRLQFQATIFDKLIAASARIIPLPLAWTILLWQVAAIFLVLHGCWRIARRCFSQTSAQWAAVATVAVLLTIPVSGTAITLADQYLHPRTLATAAIVAAIVAVLDRRALVAGLLLAIAFSVHAIMAAFGISFCVILFLMLRSSSQELIGLPLPVVPPVIPLEPATSPHPLHSRSLRSYLFPPKLALLLVPLAWLFEPASDAWRKAASTRSFYFVDRWQWYEWVGVFAPLALLYAFQWHSQRHQEERRGSALRPLILSLLYYGVLQTVVGLAIMLPPSLERLRPFEPMRYLHLLYLLFFLILGGLLGRYLLDRRTYRWLLLFVPLSAGMFYAQRQMFPATEHVEWPGASARNAWVQAFSWIRQNTPADSLFALDPHYVTAPGEDYHGFRALAERSALADFEKDAGMAARVPRLAPRWLKEVTAQDGWKNFRPADFERLKKDFGVTWVVIASEKEAPALPMTCLYRNAGISVCRLY